MTGIYRYMVNIFWSEEDHCYIAEVPELEGCVTHGKSEEAALKNSHDAIASWIHAARKLRHPIPEPLVLRRVSGKFNVRLPKQLHKSLVLKAGQEKVSLNHLVTTLLSQGV